MSYDLIYSFAMSGAAFHTLGSIEAIRPVFMIVVGVFMAVVAWRLAKLSGGWTARLMVAGVLLLAFGYAVVMPMYEAGLIEKYAPGRGAHEGSAADAMAWHVVRLVVMNFGWLVFGLGFAMHAGLLRFSIRRLDRPVSSPQTVATHESIA
jgi:hypothetical protein